MTDTDIVAALRECAAESRDLEGDYYADQFATAPEIFERAADEIERLRKREALWQWCAERTTETYGGCYRPEYAEKVEAAARELAGE
jgi:hypothetical protein